MLLVRGACFHFAFDAERVRGFQLGNSRTERFELRFDRRGLLLARFDIGFGRRIVLR